MKRLLPRLAMACAALLALTSLALAWLLFSAPGRDFALARTQAMLPGPALSWRQAEGRLAGPLTLHGLRIEGEGYALNLERLRVVPRLGALWRARLDLTEVEALSPHLRLIESAATEPSAPLRWPDDLPVVALPLTLHIERLRLSDFRLLQTAPRTGTENEADNEILHVREALGALRLGPGRARVSALRMDTEAGRLTLSGRWLGGRAPQIGIEAEFHPSTPHGDGSGLRLRANADGDSLRLKLDGRAPEPLALDLSLANLRSGPRWTLNARLDGLEPGRLWPDLPGRYAGRLAIAGDPFEGELHGELDLDGFPLVIAPSPWRWHDGLLRSEALRLELLDGRLILAGEITPTASPRFDLRLDAERLRWGEDDRRGHLPSGSAHLSGSAEDWRLEAEGELRQAEESARFALAARGGSDRARIERLHLRSPLGRAEIVGELDWRPDLSWRAEIELDGIDPAYLLPDYPGRLSGRLDSRGRWPRTRTEAIMIDATLTGLHGQIQGRRLRSEGELRLANDRGHARLDLDLGASRLRAEGRIAPDLDLSIEARPLRLPDLFPGSDGEIVGRLRLLGEANRPTVEAELRGERLRLDGLAASRFGLHGRLPARDGEGRLQLDAEGLDLAGLPAAALTLDAHGRLDDLLLGLDLEDPAWRLSARARAQARTDGGWRGRLTRLELRPPEPAADGRANPAARAWNLDQASDWSAQAGRLTLSPACLTQDAARLCLHADWPSRLDLSGRELPLALSGPWLSRRGGPFEDDPVTADGTLAFDLDLRRRDAGLEGGLSLRSSPARWRQRSRLDGERLLFDYLGLDLDLALDGERFDATLALRRADDGGLEARLSGGLDPNAALAGGLDLDIKDLTWLELLSPDLIAPRGRIQGRLALSGRRDAPVLDGHAELHDFEAELPVLGIRLRDSRLRLTGAGPERLRLDGRLDSGEGSLDLNGELRLDGGQPWLRLGFEGQRFLAIDNPELRLLASPKLSAELGDRSIALRGELEIPRARVALDRIESGVAASPDVVVLDPDGERAGRSLPIDADLRIVLGRQVTLTGFGLDARLTGGLRIRQRLDREASASGTLDVSGRYTAFDTVLEIARGRLGYADSPLDSPNLDIRAERRLDERMVGVQVLGNPRDPRISLISDPTLDSTETLSWLVLGRPLRSAGGADGEQLGAAAMALGAGGNLLAQQIGDRIGLELAVDESRNLGGSAFTVGKYLSPRLLISYGVSLLGNGQVVGLRYQLPRSLEVEVESGIEQSATLRWRHER